MAAGDGNAAGADGRRRQLNSRSRPHCSQSGERAALPPAAGIRVLMTLPERMFDALCTRRLISAEQRHCQGERLLLLGSTGHCRPFSDIRRAEALSNCLAACRSCALRRAGPL